MGTRSLGSTLAVATLALTGTPRAEPTTTTPPPAPIPPELAARLPPGGFLVASRNDSTNGLYGSDDWFVIMRVDAHGVTELVRETTSPDDMAWLDGRTLVTISAERSTDDTIVRRYVDGVLDPAATVTVPLSVWTLPKGKTRDDVDPAELLLGKGGAIWLSRCHTSTSVPRTGSVGTWGGRVCAASTYLRIDGGLVAATRAPRGIRSPALSGFRSARDGGALPRGLRAPAGYAVKLRKITFDSSPGTSDPLHDPEAPVTVKGFTCTGPGGASVRWPNPDVMDWDMIRTTRVRWISSTPPLFAVDFDAKDLHGEGYDWTSVFPACQPQAFDDFVWLGDGRWAELKEQGQQAGEQWTFHVDDMVIGTVAASTSNTLIAPLR